MDQMNRPRVPVETRLVGPGGGKVPPGVNASNENVETRGCWSHPEMHVINGRASTAK
jgi:hypothetical protein